MISGNPENLEKIASADNIRLKIKIEHGLQHIGNFYGMNKVMCLSIGTPRINKFSACSKCKINYILGFPKFGHVTA